MSSAPAAGAAAKGAGNPRRRAREFVIQGLYQHFVGGQDIVAIIAQAETVKGFRRAHRDLYDSLLNGVVEDAAALQELLQPHLDRPWLEVSPVERCILLLAACELAQHPQTPFRVIINEAIELARSYGGADGYKFINGVIDKLAPLMRPAEAKGRSTPASLRDADTSSAPARRD